MMGMRMPETCWAVFKRHTINLRDWCIWLVDLFEYNTESTLAGPFKKKELATVILSQYINHKDLWCWIQLCSTGQLHTTKKEQLWIVVGNSKLNVIQIGVLFDLALSLLSPQMSSLKSHQKPTREKLFSAVTPLSCLFSLPFPAAAKSHHQNKWPSFRFPPYTTHCKQAISIGNYRV